MLMIIIINLISCIFRKGESSDGEMRDFVGRIEREHVIPSYVIIIDVNFLGNIRPVPVPETFVSSTILDKLG